MMFPARATSRNPLRLVVVSVVKSRNASSTFCNLQKVALSLVLPRSQQRRQSSSSSSSSSSITLKAIPEFQAAASSFVSLTPVVQPYFDLQQPLVLRQLLTTTPKNKAAMKQFSQWDEYWQQRIADSATSNNNSKDIDCHVELGGNYSKSQIVNVPLSEFILYMSMFQERFGTRSVNNTTEKSDDNNGPQDDDHLLYLAQNDIFAFVLDDIDLPSFLMELGQAKLYSTMIWMGPYGCVSPLHFDPLDNVLMQFMGVKEATLCPPNSPVHAGAENNQRNTSAINPDNWDASAQKYPSVYQVDFCRTTLYPGDALYIPQKWFHYIKTVETSVSINSWFR